MLFSTRSTAFLLSTAFVGTSVHAYVKAVQPVKSSYEVNTPREYAKYWNSGEMASAVMEAVKLLTTCILSLTSSTHT